jgi:hypothetical protein
MKSKIDVCLTHFHSFRHIEFTLGVVNRLRKLGMSVLVLTNKPKVQEYLNKNNIISESLNVKRSTIYSNKECFILFEEFSKKYNIKDNFIKFIEVDYAQSGGLYANRLELKNKVISSFLSIEESLSKYDISVYVQMLASEIERRVFYYYGNLHGKAFYYHNSLLPIKPFVFIKNEFQEVAILKKTKIISRKCIFFYNALIKERGGATYLRKIENRKINFLQKNKTFLSDYQYYRSKKKTLLRLFFFEAQIQKKILYRLRSFFSKNIDSCGEYPKGKYIFFPLHQPNEAQTLVRGGGYHDEIFLLDYITKTMPNDCKLVCKMHPRVEFQYDRSWISKIKNMDSVELVDSRLDSVEIMKNSVVTVTINSSVWMESMILNLPCLTFGKGYFSWDSEYPYQVDLNSFLIKYKLAESKNLVNKKFNISFLNEHFAQAFLMKRIKGSSLTPKWLGNAIYYLKHNT